MPWHVAEGSAECPKSRPYAVVKDATGEVEGCHASREKANRQLSALYASENSVGAFHLPEKHDQSDHGNGATGVGVWKGGKVVEGSKAAEVLGPLPDDAELSRQAGESRAAVQRLGEHREGADPEERSADTGAYSSYRNYVGEGYKQLNGALRQGSGQHQSESVVGMDRAFEKAGFSLDRPVRMQRGIKADIWESMPHEPGSVVVDDGYMSTTTSEGRGRFFASGIPKGVVLDIKVPAGVTMLGGDGTDSEIILPRGSQLRLGAPQERDVNGRVQVYVPAEVVRTDGRA